MANESELLLNVSNSSDYDYLIPFEDYDFHHEGANGAVGSIFIIFIIVGVVTNVLGLASLIHFRMWLKHEGYVYLAAIFAANIGILLFDSTTYCIIHWNHSYYPADSSDFMCKVSHFLMSIFFSPGWLSVALLFNIYLREHLTHRRRCGCLIFAAKYCTLFASKIVVGIIFAVVFILRLPVFAIFKWHDDPHHGRYCSIDGNIELYLAMLYALFGLMWFLPFAVFLPVILLLTLCISRDGDQFGFSGIGERTLAAEQFRTVAVTLSSANLFSYFLVGFLHRTIFLGSLFVTALETSSAFSTGFQPVFCFIILKEFRIEILRKLRELGCWKCLPQRCWPSDNELRVRLQELEENVEQE